MSDYFDKLAKTWDQNPMRVKRARITAEYCKRLSLRDSRSLLDFGGGTGLLSSYLHDSFDSVTIADTSKEMLKIAREKIKEAKILNIKTFQLNNDISEIPDKYSAIIMLMSLHHIIDIDKFFHDASNILYGKGVLMVADLYKEDGSFHKHIQDYAGHNGFEIEQLSKKLERAGLTVVHVNKYFEIKKKNFSSEDHIYPLFFLVAEKQEFSKQSKRL